MIWDCIIFNNELELLEIRLHELDEHVHKWVLVESAVDFRRNPKPLVFEEHKQDFAQWLPRINHVVVNDLPAEGPWGREFQQRDATAHGLTEASPDDLIIFGDADEIINPDLLGDIAYRAMSSGPVTISMPQFYHTIQWKLPIVTYRTNAALLKDIGPSFGAFADKIFGNNLVQNGGWHFSCLGGAQRLYEKLKSFSHIELDTPEVTLEYCEDLIRNGLDIVPGRFEMTKVEIDDTYPKWLRENLDRFPILLDGGVS